MPELEEWQKRESFAAIQKKGRLGGLCGGKYPHTDERDKVVFVGYRGGWAGWLGEVLWGWEIGNLGSWSHML